MGDPIIERSVDYVLADEITHVRMGSKWMRKLTEGDPERLARAQMFQENIDNLFNFQGGRTTQEDARQVHQKLGDKEVEFDATLTIAKDARLLAGFTKKRSIGSSREWSRAPPTENMNRPRARSASRGGASGVEGNSGDITQKFIPVDKLARPDNFVVMRGKQVREIREEQGTRGTSPALRRGDAALAPARHHDRASSRRWRPRAARCSTSPMRRGNSSSTWRARSGTNPVTSKFSSACWNTWAARPATTSRPRSCGDARRPRIPPRASRASIGGSRARACDVFDQLIRIAQRNGDKVIEQAVDYVLADEITHVRMGSKWMRKLTEGDPERLQRALAFQEMVDEVFNFRGGRRAAEDLKVDDGMLLTIAKEARMLAGFTEEEIQRLVESARKSAAY